MHKSSHSGFYYYITWRSRHHLRFTWLRNKFSILWEGFTGSSVAVPGQHLPAGWLSDFFRRKPEQSGWVLAPLIIWKPVRHPKRRAVNHTILRINIASKCSMVCREASSRNESSQAEPDTDIKLEMMSPLGPVSSPWGGRRTTVVWSAQSFQRQLLWSMTPLLQCSSAEKGFSEWYKPQVCLVSEEKPVSYHLFSSLIIA